MCAMEQYLATPQLELRVLAMCLAEIVTDELRPDDASLTANAKDASSDSAWPKLEFQVCSCPLPSIRASDYIVHPYVSALLQYEDSAATREIKRIRALLKSSEFWTAASTGVNGSDALAPDEHSSGAVSVRNDDLETARASAPPAVASTNDSKTNGTSTQTAAAVRLPAGRSTAPRYLRECLEGLLTHCAPDESASGRAASAGTPREESRLRASMFFSDADQFLVCLRAAAPLIRTSAQVLSCLIHCNVTY